MGYRLALSGAIATVAIAWVATTGSSGFGSGMVGAEAQAAPAHASAARGGRIAAITRRKMNRVRAQHGVHRLRYSRSLTRSAHRHARFMARNGFGHLTRIRASSAFRSLAEIILKHRGSHPRPGTAIRGWTRSSAHRSIMLAGRFRSVGIGKVSSGGVTYWTAHLGRR